MGSQRTIEEDHSTRMRGRAEIKATAKSDETRDRIVREALALFQERGFEAATMREIAAKAGVATGAAYYYFPSKDAIVMEFYRRSAEEMQTSIAAVLEGVNRFEDRLRE